MDPEENEIDDVVGDILEHHGIKGMKWGIRNKRKRSRAQGGKHNTGPHHLSDQELRDAIARMQLEQTYHSLSTNPNKKKKDKGESFSKTLAKSLVTIALTTAVKGAVGSAFKDGGKKGKGGGVVANAVPAVAVAQKMAKHVPTKPIQNYKLQPGKGPKIHTSTGPKGGFS